MEKTMLYEKEDYADTNAELCTVLFSEDSAEKKWRSFLHKLHWLTETYIGSITVTERSYYPRFKATIKLENMF